MSHLGFQVLSAESPADLKRGAIVLPYPYAAMLSFLERSLERLRALWSPELAESVRSGRIRIILDASAEGIEHSPPLMEAFHRALSELGIPPRRAFVVTQDRNFARDHAAFCAEHEMADPVKVLNYDLWIKRFHTQFEQEPSGRFEFCRDRFRGRAPRRGRRFVSLNLTARPVKVLFLLSLLRDDLWDQGYISFHGFDRRARADTWAGGVQQRSLRKFAREMRAERHFETLVEELIPRLPDLDAKGVIHFSDDPNAAERPGYKAPLQPIGREYEDSWFSVITETEMRSRPSRITEKPFKSLVSFHPVVVFGNPGALRAIRDLGYVTFGETIDERYDEEEDPRRRFDMAYAEVLRLCRLSEDELGRMERQVADKLEFNAEWGMRRMAAEFRGRIDPELIEQLFEDLPEA
jgi:hypothetical protein